MAVKNSNLGGSDWGSSTVIKSIDLNDTFDAAINILRTNPAFWLNTNSYDVYDDFDSISLGSFSSGNDDWDVTVTGSASITNTSSVLAGGSNKEIAMRLTANSAGAVTMSATSFNTNRSIFTRVYGKFGSAASSGSNDTTFSFSLNGTNWYTCVLQDDEGSDDTFNSMILVVAEGDDTYTIYFGGKVIASSVTVANAKPHYKLAGDGDSFALDINLDDVRYTKTSV